jgi:hypothetical protein
MLQLRQLAVCEIAEATRPLAPAEAVNARELWKDGYSTAAIAEFLSAPESRIAATVLVKGNISYMAPPAVIGEDGRYRVKGKYTWGWAG